MANRLMEVCVAALARWCDTYLLPEEALPPALEQALGPMALEILDMAVQVANTCLVQYPGETTLHGQVGDSLSHSRHRSLILTWTLIDFFVINDCFHVCSLGICLSILNTSDGRILPAADAVL